MIVFAIALDQLSIKVLADLRKNSAKVLDGEFRQYVPAIFGYKDQVGMKCVNNVPSSTNVGIFRQLAPRWTNR